MNKKAANLEDYYKYVSNPYDNVNKYKKPTQNKEFFKGEAIKRYTVNNSAPEGSNAPNLANSSAALCHKIAPKDNSQSKERTSHKSGKPT
jgi:hypothetical protein